MDGYKRKGQIWLCNISTAILRKGKFLSLKIKKSKIWKAIGDLFRKKNLTFVFHSNNHPPPPIAHPQIIKVNHCQMIMSDWAPPPLSWSPDHIQSNQKIAEKVCGVGGWGGMRWGEGSGCGLSWRSCCIISWNAEDKLRPCELRQAGRQAGWLVVTFHPLTEHFLSTDADNKLSDTVTSRVTTVNLISQVVT